MKTLSTKQTTVFNRGIKKRKSFYVEFEDKTTGNVEKYFTITAIDKKDLIDTLPNEFLSLLEKYDVRVMNLTDKTNFSL